MKLLLGIIVTLLASVWLALLLKQNPGYAMFSFGEWTVETSFTFMVITFIVLFILFYFLIRLALRFWRSPALTSAASRRWQQRQARHLLDKGIQQMATGHAAAAEKTLLKGAAYSANPAQYYLSAARAIHQCGDEKWRRDLHLREAEGCPQADLLAVQLMRAEFLLDDQQAEQARPILEALRQQHPHHPGVLHWLAKTYQQLADWKRLQPLLAELQKKGVLAVEPLAALQQQTYQGLLTAAVAGGSLEQLQALWRQIPVELREQDETLVVAYATALCEFGAFEDAETLLRAAINRRWSPKLVVGYGMLERGNTTAQLAAAEGWLTAHGNDPHLLLTLGRLAKRGQQPAKARDYLERSIKLMPTPDAYQELGELLQTHNEPAAAGQCFQAGLRLLLGKPEEKQGLTLPATGTTQQLAGPAPTA